MAIPIPDWLKLIAQYVMAIPFLDWLKQLIAEHVKAIPILDWLNQLIQLDYVWNYEDKVKKLDEAATKLQKEKEMVHDTAREGEDRYGREVYDHVKIWLDEVDGIISRHKEFKEDGRHGKARPLALSNLVIRYDLSKRAQEIKANVDEMLRKEKHDNINILSRWRGPLSMWFPLAEVEYVNFNSRSKTLEKIMEKLKDPSARMIGVYGFSGVGKTTLVTQAANRALKGGLFHVVTMANVTQSPDIKIIQGQIADMLGIKLEEESEYGRAARIKQRLKREKKNILIILDDLFAKVDLSMLGISLQGDDGSKKNLINLKEGKSSTARNEKTADRTPAGSSEIENTSAGPRESNIQETPAADPSADPIESNIQETPAADPIESKMQETSDSFSKVTEECQNWCKVLLISEVKQVLTRMDVKENLIFSVGLLEDKESDTLFRKMAGIDNNKNPEFEKLATKIVKKCEDLPMSIVTIARAVKNQTLLVWKETNQKLEGQNVTGTIECSTKLNYELLESEELKGIFLLCARMSHDALVADLVKYCIGLGFLRGIYTVRDARGRVQMSLAKLKQSGLLSDSYSSDRFTMQNLVRDAALSISSQDNHVFTLTGGKLDEWPDVDKLERYTAICLRHCDVIEKFPESMKCPRLRVFQVENNGRQLEIPDNFFQEMQELRVLILTGFSLSQLPSSIGCLKKLRMLCLEQCIIGKDQLCIIEKLTNLRILSFSGSDIESLPIELNHLSKLQIFDISHCSKLSKIPANVISNLTSLEELYMRNTQWWVEEGQNFSLSELGHLNQLTNLDLQIPSVTNLPNDLFFDKLNIYKIVIGSSNIHLEPDFKIPESYELSRILAIREKDGCDIHSLKGIKMMFDRVEDLLLEKVIGVQDVFYALNLKGFPCLNHLSIVCNSSIEYLINPKDPRKKKPEEAFTKLKSLHLYKLEKMKQICFCELSLSKTSFENIKVIKIKLCHKLESVFSISMVGHLISLETVEVSECNSLTKIVPVQTSNAIKSLKLPKLRSLMLQSLSEFIGFYPPSPEEEPVEEAQILFHEKIEVPELEIMELSYIPINQIWDERSFFKNLIHLEVKGCGNMKYLLLFSMAENLEKLQNIFVSECDRMEHIFSQEQGSNAKDKNSMPPKLKNIKLSRMRCLSKIWDSKVPLDPIDNLDTLIIEECDELVDVFDCDTVGIFQSLGSLTVKNCKSMKAIYDLAGENQDGRYKTKLQDIHLETLPKLEHVLKRKKHQEDVLNLNNIRKIWLQDCERLENIYPSSADKTFENLEYLVARGCSRLREIVAKGEEASNNQTSSTIKFKFPALTTVKFLELPKFRSFYPGDCKLSVPKLNELSVEHCEKLIKLFKEENDNSQGIFPDKVIYKLKSIQIESRHATSSTSYDRRWDNLEELHLSGLRNIEILYSFLYHNPSLKSLWLNSCSFGVLVPLERPTEIERLGVVPKLKSLTLTNLPWLKEIGFERDIIFQRVELLILKNCPCLHTISPSSLFLSHLTNLEVVDCDTLKYLMSPSTAKSLVQLNTMKVINCVSLEDIVSKQVREEQNTSKFNIIFGQLKALELVSLKNLKSFCRSKNCAFEFPSLDKFVVSACPKLENFAEESKSTTFLQKVYTVHEKENRWCWKGNLQDTIRYMFKEKKFFEGKVELNVSYHPELEEVWQRKESPLKYWFYSLKTLKLNGCQFETYAIPSNVLARLKSLQELEVGFCGNITFIFEMNDIKIRETPLRLKKLTLRWLPNVTHVWQQEQEDKQGILSFKNLQQVSVMGCDKLQTLFPAALARDLRMLEKLEVVSCAELPQIVGKEEEAADGTVVFPRLTTLTLHWLPKKFFEGMDELEVCQRIDGPPKLWFYSLKTMTLENCKFETCAIPSNILLCLKSLQELEVRNCSNITFIFEMNDPKIGETTPRLKKLTLKELKDVKHLWQLEQQDEQRILSFKNLQQVSVIGCDKLQTLLPAALARDLKMLEKLEVTACHELPQIVGNEEEAADGTENVFVFPRLTSLVLYSLRKLTCFYSQSSLPKAHLIAVECPELNYFDVRSCPKLELFRSQQESDRKDQGCSFFSDIKVISKVEKLYLSWKDASVWLGQSKDQDLQYLSELYLGLGNYEKKNFPCPPAILEKASNQEKMEIGRSLKEISLKGKLGQLKILALCNLDELHSIWVLEYLPKLQELRVFNCPSLRTLVQPSAAKMLTDLEEMSVEGCKSMKEIVGKGQDETAVQGIKFERLEMISLIDLWRLEYFYSGNATLQLPSLIQVDILGCPKMKSFSKGLRHVGPPSRLIQVSYDPYDKTELVLHHELNVVVRWLPVIEEEGLVLGDYPELKGIWLGKEQIPFGRLFRNLNYLEVEGCEFLSNAILPSHLLPFLSNLEELVVSKCHSAETIFDVKDTATNNSNMSVIPLKKLTLEQLPTLRHVWNEDPKARLSLPYQLEEVIVSECKNIESLFPASVPKDSLQKLDVRSCARLVEIVAKEDTAATEEANHKLDVFSKITSLTLRDLPKLRWICSGMSILDWPELENLDVSGCPMLTIFATDSLSSPDSYPEQDEDHFTSEKHGIISAQKIPPNLERLSLGKENVIMIEQGLLPHVDLLLQNIKFLTFQGFDKDSDAFPHVFFSKVPLPSIQEFTVIDSAFRKTPHYTTRSFSSRPKILELRSQRKPNSIRFEHTSVTPLVENPQQLEVLAWSCLKNLTIFVSFSRLTELNVKDCAGLKHLFTSSTARSLVVLRNMSIINCESLETVVVADDEEGDKKDECVVFADLSSLSLKKLPKLGSFDIVTNLALSTVSFSRLTELNVEDYAGLKYLFTSSTARSLVALRNMSIINCESLETVVVADDEEGDIKDEGVVFAYLSSLSLKKLPKLGSFDIVTNLAPSSVSFSRLTMLNVEDCAGLKYLFTSSTAKRLVESEKMSITNCESLETVVVADDEVLVFPDLQKLDVRNCAELEEIVAKDDETPPEEASKKVAVFPKVTSLTLWDLPKLRCICSGTDILDWPVLQDLNVCRCQMLKIFATDFQNSPDLYLEGQDHFTAHKYGIISADKVPPNLERMSLSKENVIMIEQGLVPHADLLLQNIKFLKLQGFDKDSDAFPHVFFSKVPLHSIQEFTVVDSGFEKTPHYTTKSFSSRPKILELRSQRKPNSIRFEYTCVTPLVENPQQLEVLAWSCLKNLTIFVSFSRLTELNVKDCAGLKYLFTSSTARSLVVLRNMSIINCDSLETVVEADDKEGDKKDEGVVFAYLSSLSLKKLPKLGSFDIVTNLAPSTVSFSRLTMLNVEHCAGLKYLFTSSTTKKLVGSEKMSIPNCESLETVVVADNEDVVFPNLQKLDVRNCAELEEIVANHDETATEEVSKKVAVFPKVTSLTLWDLPKLRCICSGMDNLDWPVLQDLDVYHCQMLKIFATDFQNSPYVHREGQDHFTTNKHGIISADKVSPNLERLSLDKEDFILIEQGLLPHVDLQKLKFLGLQGFNNDSDVFLPEVFFSKVSLPSVQGFRVADSAFKEIFPSQIPGMDFTTKSFSLLKKLELRSLYRLESIGFEHTWVGPLVENLQHLKVLACTCLTNLALSTVSFSRLTELNVEDCTGLKYLFSSSTARSLVVLSEMSIINCESLETVVEADDEEGGQKDEDVKFTNLFSLSLKKLPKLGSFYTGNSTLKFQSLFSVEITQCKSIKTFSHGDVEVGWLSWLEIDDDDLNSAVRQQFEKAGKQPPVLA